MWKLFDKNDVVLDLTDDFRDLLIRMENRAAFRNVPPIINRIDYLTGDHIDHVYGNLYAVFGRGGQQLCLKTIDYCSYHSTLGDPFSLELELIRWRGGDTPDDFCMSRIWFANGYHAVRYGEL